MPWEPIVTVVALWCAAGMTAADVLVRHSHDGWHWLGRCAPARPSPLLLVADRAQLVGVRSAQRRATTPAPAWSSPSGHRQRLP